MKIVATSLAHDGSACFLEDGQIKYWNKQERLSRIKRQGVPMLPLLEIERNFDLSNLDTYVSSAPFQEIDCAFFSEASFFNWFSVSNPFYNYFRSVHPKTTQSALLSHHLAHAACAFYGSGYDSAYVLVVDRNGSVFLDFTRRVAVGVETETLYYCQYPSQFEIVYRNPPHWVGITGAYSLVSERIGIGQMENGKTMGLSAYGSDCNAGSLFSGLAPVIENGSSPVNDGRLLCRITGDAKYRNEIFGKSLPTGMKDEDLAFLVQKQSTETILKLIADHVDPNRCANLCFTGGHAHNCLLNYQIANRFDALNFYPDPLADDSGTSLGAAQYCWYQTTQSREKMPLLDIYGCGLSDSQLLCKVDSPNPLTKY